MKAPFDAQRAIDFARSELFERTFKEGMGLVEETAAYLDGPGRAASKRLSRAAALAYAGESMRLTTRLMQVASWLLVQRAVREGDMAAEAACEDRYRLAGEQGGSADVEIEDAGDLPGELSSLVGRAERLFDRVRRLDQQMFVESPEIEEEHPVLSQLDRLKRAFGG